jgi:hypothetical protein
MDQGVIIPFAMFAFVGVMGRLVFAMIGLGCGSSRRSVLAGRGATSLSSPLVSDR